jgi:hypothetical protein
MLKCHLLLHWCLGCTICYPPTIYTSSKNKIIDRTFVTFIYNFLILLIAVLSRWQLKPVKDITEVCDEFKTLCYVNAQSSARAYSITDTPCALLSVSTCTNAHVGNSDRPMGCFDNTICIEQKDRDQSTPRGHCAKMISFYCTCTNALGLLWYTLIFGWLHLHVG